MRVRVEPDRVVKRLDASEVGGAVARVAALRASGVPSPFAWPGEAAGEIVFERIGGTDGLSLVSHEGTGALPAILRALTVLHAVPAGSVPRYDACARIWPRLHLAPDWVRPELDRWRPLANGSAARLVHGDFHAGQVIRDSSGDIWLLDFDDLAAGPPEADLGNFAAHLSTRPETRRGPAADDFDAWLQGVVAAYPGGVSFELAHSYGRLALIRRGLKLAERGDTGALSDIGRAVREGW